MVSSVRRSHFEAVGEREREWYRAVLRRKGTLGMRNDRMEASMIVLGCCVAA